MLLANGKNSMDKVVVFTGAGFSAPAEIPLQSNIIKEMFYKPTPSFLESTKESKKLLKSFILIGLFLLDEYSTVDTAELHSMNRLFKRLNKIYEINKVNNDDDELAIEQIKKLNERTNYNPFCEIAAFDMLDAQVYRLLLLLKESIREKLVKSRLLVNLEDVFTIFDKAIKSKENWHRFSYNELDSLEHALLRLFTYYFGRRINSFNNFNEYDSFIKYIELHKVTVISSNWDVILEKNFIHNKIKYDLCLNSEYYKSDLRNNNLNAKSIKYLKLHGSINWFHCLECGTVNLIEKKDIGTYLFDDKINEQCLQCKASSNSDMTLLRPEIITPTMVKDIKSQLYNNIWKKAEYELNMANKIIFLGYSLPIADFEIRYLLKKNIDKKTKIDVVLIETDKPDANNNSPEFRFKSLFSKNEIEFHYNGFNNYFKTV